MRLRVLLLSLLPVPQTLGQTVSLDGVAGTTISGAPPADQGDPRLRGDRFDTGKYDEYKFNGNWQSTPFPRCPAGRYATELLTIDGCKLCPKGRFGRARIDTETGLIGVDDCTLCPPGRFSDVAGAKAEDECRACPQGTYGSALGLQSAACSGRCPSGRFSSHTGLVRKSECRLCPTGYRGWQCGKPHEDPDEEEDYFATNPSLENVDELVESWETTETVVEEPRDYYWLDRKRA